MYCVHSTSTSTVGSLTIGMEQFDQFIPNALFICRAVTARYLRPWFTVLQISVLHHHHQWASYNSQDCTVVISIKPKNA